MGPLRADDLVTVLGTKEFAEDCFEKGMIVNALGAPRKHTSAFSTLPTTPKLNRVVERDEKEVVPQKEKVDAADVLCIPLEDPLPCLPDLQQERNMLKKQLADSLAREKALRAQLRACHF